MDTIDERKLVESGDIAREVVRVGLAEAQQFEPDVTWRSGCIELDKDFVRYLGKLVVSGAVLAFSFVQLTREGVDVA